MTSTSASRMASAIASQPLMSCSVSTSWCSRSLTWTAIRPPPRARPSASPRAPLAADSLLVGRGRGPGGRGPRTRSGARSAPFVARSFVTSGRRSRVRGRIRVARAFPPSGGSPHLRVSGDPALRLEPLVVSVVVLLPELPLVLVVLELELVDHHDAVLHRTDLRADPATDARLVDDLVVPLGGDLKALVRTVEPAHRALDARVEVDDRPQRARAVLLVLRVSLPGLARVDDDAW